MPRYVDLDNPKIIRGERDRFGLVVYHIPPDTPCRNLAERQKGEWIGNGDIPKECPFCGEDWDKYVFGEVWYTGELPNFCPNCGADMRGKNNGKIT